MTKAQRINRGMFALGFLGAYSLAAMLLLLTLKAGLADAGAGVTHRNGDVVGGSNDFTGDVAALTDFEKYPGRLGPDKDNPAAPDDATSAIADGPPASGFFADNGFSGPPEDLQQASFVTGTDAPGRGRANFAPPLTGGGVPEFGGGGGAPFGGPTFIPSSPGGSGAGLGSSSNPPAPNPPVVDTPPTNPPSDPPPGPLGRGPDLPPVPGPDVPPPGGPPPVPPDLPPPDGPNPTGPVLSVPEPLTLSIFAMGLAGVAALRRRRKMPA